MANFYERCQEAARRRMRAFLLAWLADLPAGGWAGTAAELEVEWCSRAAVLPRHEQPIVPSPKGVGQCLRGEEGTLAEAGWRAEFRRTAAARTISVIRLAPPGGR